MALTDAQTTQIFGIFGVPQNGSGTVVDAVATVFGPACESVDMSAIVARINAKLTALNSEQITRVGALLLRWDAITSTSPLRVTRSASTSGVAVDHPAERAAIRTALSNIIGVAVTSGGFAAEAARAHQTTMGR
ncbi:MAG: hypothetical protein WCT04_20020 [Planctomycetota bacterium]